MQAAWRDLFIGRSRELGVLESALAAAATGRGGVVLLAGEPGIGKTRTAAEFARRAREAGAEVLAGRCYEGEGAPAFWPWLQVLRAYSESRDAATLAAELGTAAPDVGAVYPDLHTRLPGLANAPLLDPEQARFRFFDGVTRGLLRAAGSRPLVIWIDDLHGADEPSLRLLQFLARGLPASRVLVMGGLRDVALARDHPLAPALAELMRDQQVELVRLDGLAESEVAALLEGVLGEPTPPGLAVTVHARTEGNPLYTMEVARALATAPRPAAAGSDRLHIPESVRLAIGARMGALSEACRQILAQAALFGREFGAEALARASGAPLSSLLPLLDEAESARVIERAPVDPWRWRFTHVLYGETLVDALSATARGPLHAAVAQALESDRRANEHIAEIAHHWLEAGPAGEADRAVESLCRAADRAQAHLAYEEAVRLYQRALGTLRAQADPGEASLAAALLGLGEASKSAGQTQQARAAFLEAATIGRKLGLAGVLTRAALGFSPSMTFARQFVAEADVVRLLDESIAAWGDQDSGLHACALARLALAHTFGDRELSIALAARALAMARRVGDVATLRYVLARWLGTNSIELDPVTRLATANELVRLAEAESDLEALAVGRLWRCVQLVQAGDARTMRKELPALMQLAGDLRQPVWSWYAAAAEASCAVLDGRFEAAERAIDEALRVGRADLPFAAHAHFVFSMMILRVLQGRAGEFVADYRAVTEGHPSPAALAPLAWAEAARDNTDEVRRLVASITADDFQHVGDAVSYLIVMCFLAEAFAFLQDTAGAARLYERIAPLASSSVRWVVFSEPVPTIGPIAHYLGLLARTQGRLDRAAAHFEDALAEAKSAEAPPHLARAQLEYALVLRVRGAPGDGERAAQLLAEARATASAIGMAGIIGRIDALDALLAAPADRSAPQLFRRDGDYWTIAYAGKEIRLRDMRGLHYLATLLREPGREFHASDLVRAGRGPTFAPVHEDALEVATGLGDAGERLDARASAAYRARLSALAEEISAAEQRNDLGRLERARDEREMLLAELSAAARGKRASSDAERARLAATKAIGMALDRLAASHPELGAHLHATVRRGYFCSYVPDPRHPIEWVV